MFSTAKTFLVFTDVPIQRFLFQGVILMLFMREEGQGLVEYAMILMLVALVVIAVLALIAPQIGSVFSTTRNSLMFD
jgi:pilus assembly protein Flp/PilA